MIVVLTHGTFDFGMSCVTYKDNLPALIGVMVDFDMDLGNKRAGCIKNLQPAQFGFFLNGFGDAMGTEYHCGVFRYLGKFFDEYRASFAQAVNDITVMDHLVADIDRCAKHLYRAIYDFYRAINACAKTSGIR
jgi:hypothetical protein